MIITGKRIIIAPSRLMTIFLRIKLVMNMFGRVWLHSLQSIHRIASTCGIRGSVQSKSVVQLRSDLFVDVDNIALDVDTSPIVHKRFPKAVPMF